MGFRLWNDGSGPAVGLLYGSNGETLLDKRLGMLVGLLVRLSRHEDLLAKNEAEAQAHAARVAAREGLVAERRARQGAGDHRCALAQQLGSHADHSRRSIAGTAHQRRKPCSVAASARSMSAAAAVR